MSDDATDWPQLYRDHVAAVTKLAGSLDDEQVHQRVPGTPEWDVREVYAHLAGGPADSRTGDTEGAPGPAWTAKHVAARADVALPELVAELNSLVDATAASLADARMPGVVFDISTHHADLHEALGRGRLPAHLYEPVVALLAPHRAAAIVDDVDHYELFRALFSRRSRAQMQAWGTTVSPEELDAVCVFGPRDDDQPQPPA